MTAHIKEAGSWTNVSEIHVKENGAWTNITEGYYKENGQWTLVFVGAQAFTLTSAENLILEDFLVANGARPNADITVTLPVNEVLGSTIHGSAALRMGDLNAYRSVTLECYGKIHGKGGTSSNLNGSNAIGWGTAITVNAYPGAEIYAGGGAGGKGGKGANGNNAHDWTRYSVNTYDLFKTYWKGNVCSGPGSENDKEDYYSRWQNHAVGQPCSFPYIWDDDQVVNTIYKSGGSTGSFSNPQPIDRSPIGFASGGTGGKGGDGEGYNQSASVGDKGNVGPSVTQYNITRSATYLSAGRGGTGGTGGTWAQSGNTGAAGGSGGEFYKHSSANASQRWRALRRTTYGTAGSAGGSPGMAIANPETVLNDYGASILGAIA